MGESREQFYCIQMQIHQTHISSSGTPAEAERECDPEKRATLTDTLFSVTYLLLLDMPALSHAHLSSI